MKANFAVVVCGALLLGALTAPRSAEAVGLTPGTYNVYAQLVSFNITQGNWCLAVPLSSAGNYILLFPITYNGGRKATAAIPLPYIGNNGSATGPLVALLTLPPTPSVGSTTWDGEYTEALQPGNSTFTPLTFTGTLTPTSTTSFLGTMVLSGLVVSSSATPDICDLTLQYVATFAGPLSSELPLPPLQR